jgi:type IV secretory pathway VirB10-like protein
MKEVMSIPALIVFSMAVLAFAAAGCGSKKQTGGGTGTGNYTGASDAETVAGDVDTVTGATSGAKQKSPPPVDTVTSATSYPPPPPPPPDAGGSTGP